MPLTRVSPGRDVPNDINVIIEIPWRSDPVKYEVDKASGAMFVDRFLTTPMYYPCNYGYVPQTLSDDGDPLDVLVPTPYPLLNGTVIPCRPVGMLKVVDEAGRDAKIIAVPADRLTDLYRAVETVRDLPPVLLSQIAHFYNHYKDLDPERFTQTEGWVGPEEAKAEIRESVERYERKGFEGAEGP
jgi:inorganic pyrophosphatase